MSKTVKDVTINKNKNITGLTVDVDKRDVAQIYVVQIKQKLKAEIAQLKEDKDALNREGLTLTNEIEELINSLVEKECKSKIDKINQAHKALRAVVKEECRKAAKQVDTALKGLFEDHEDIDSRISYTVPSPKVTYDWRAAKVVKSDGSGSEEVIQITINYNNHTETKDVKIPSKISSLKVQFKAVETQVNEKLSVIAKLNKQLDSSSDLQEAAEASVAMAKLDQSEFGKQCLDNLSKLAQGNGILNIETTK